MNSEAIYQALFDQLSNIQGMVTVSRRLRHFNHVGNEKRPALFITQGNQDENAVKGLNAKIELAAEVYLYIYEADPEKAIGMQINHYLDAIREAMKPEYPEMCEYQTLGGLVEHCWIDGTIEVFEGVDGMIDGQGIAIVPIRILTTN
ncbi:hypothetical protein ACFODO_23790 [Acinetobacter sichuanensis]|uniref:DUF3168 domain-containing protein n=1 Tax=Acinetobacter sichuanensis TaxID=2136183 RepID=A0A371YK44_9GAMM|nr:MULTISPECIES: hypothetical protein [Acinetobacter]MDM1765723.1 hypothetical protein [Acinetobacter sp. 226-1]MDM1769390.1 hypothetical protein [Acinetobacter sp. 226-4]RFC81827.1 hypothetical protein C9E89_019725 [Acinetobacter sichuanensis]